jgi:hypothetical protein
MVLMDRGAVGTAHGGWCVGPDDLKQYRLRWSWRSRYRLGYRPLLTGSIGSCMHVLIGPGAQSAPSQRHISLSLKLKSNRFLSFELQNIWKIQKKIKFCPHPLINTPTVGANFTAISTHFEFPHAHSKSSLSASLVSQSSPEGSQDSV